MRAGIADQERVAVGGRLGDARAADHAGGGGDVLDHDRLPEQLAHALRLDARADIDAATGGKRNDERDRPRRPILRGGVRAKRDNHCRGDHQPVHAHLPLAPTLARRTDGIKSVVVTAMLWARGRTGRTYVGFAALDVTGGAFVGRNKRSALRHCAACRLAGLLIVSP